MTLPGSGTITVITGNDSVQHEMYDNNNVNTLSTLSLAASKTATHNLSEFYGFDGLCTFDIDLVSSDPSNTLGSRILDILSTNILNRNPDGVKLTSTSMAYRQSDGIIPNTSGSVYMKVQITLASNHNFTVATYLAGVSQGISTDNDSYTGIWYGVSNGSARCTMTWAKVHAGNCDTRVEGSVTLSLNSGHINYTILNSADTYGLTYLAP